MKNEKRWNMSTIRNLDISEFSIVEKPETRYLVTVPISHDTPFEQEIEMVVAETKKYQLRRLHDASYGAILPVENLYCGNLNGYSALYIELPFPTHRKGLHVQPKGKYLRAFAKEIGTIYPDVIRKFSPMQRKTICNFAVLHMKKVSTSLSLIP